MPTGSGKTTVFCDLLIKSKGKCLMVVSGRKLVSQASERLDFFGVDHGVIMSGHKRYDPSRKIQVCSIDTINSRGEYPDNVKFIVIDEAHLATSPKFLKFLSKYDCHILSVTATPFSPRSLSHICDDYLEPITFDELVYKNFLVPPIYYSLTHQNFDDLPKRHTEFGKEFVTKDLYERMSNLTTNIVENYIKFGEGRPSILFAVNIAHSKDLSNQFNKAGIPSVHIDSSTPEQEKNQSVTNLLTNRIKIICNVGIFCTGVDIPPVSCIMLARATLSVNLYIQMIGRGTRPFLNKKDFIVLDFGGNVLRHGFVNERREINLETKEVERKNKMTYWTCSECFLINTGKFCLACNSEQKILNAREPKKITKHEELLQRIEKSPDVYAIALQEFRKLQAVAKKNGLMKGWLYHKMKKTFGDGMAKRIVYGQDKRTR